MIKDCDIIGVRYGRLTVITESHKVLSGSLYRRRFICQCDCGNRVTVFLHNLREGATRSCGCLVGDRRRERARNVKNTESEARNKVELEQFSQCVV